MGTPILKRHSVRGESFNPDSAENVYIPYLPKKLEDHVKIREEIKNLFLFRDLEDEQIDIIVNSMEQVEMKKNETVYKEGDVGNAFYVIKSGCFGIYSSGILESFVDKGYFGEISLMYESPRLQTVTALTDGSLWKLHRFVFRRIVVTDSFRKRVFYGQVISTVPSFKTLTKSEKNKVLDALQYKTYEDGQVIAHGHLDGIVLVEKGEVNILKNTENLRVYEKSEFFGDPDFNLEEDETAVAVGLVRVAYLETERVERLLGPLKILKNRH